MNNKPSAGLCTAQKGYTMGKTKLATIRKEKGFTQVALAEKTGLNPRHIANFECGYRDIETASYKTVKALADALGVRPEDIV